MPANFVFFRELLGVRARAHVLGPPLSPGDDPCESCSFKPGGPLDVIEDTGGSQLFFFCEFTFLKGSLSLHAWEWITTTSSR